MKVTLLIIRLVMAVLVVAFFLDMVWLVGLMSGPGLPIAGNYSVPARDLPMYAQVFGTLLVMLVLLPVLFVVALVAEGRLSRPNREAE